MSRQFSISKASLAVARMLVIGLCATQSPKNSLAADGLEPSFFDDPTTRFRLQISSNDLKRLAAQPSEFVPAQFQEGTRESVTVGVHLIENRGSEADADKPSLMVRLDQYAPGQKLQETSILLLHGPDTDAGFLRRYVGAQFAALLGVPAGRVGHARVEINGRARGLYVVSEGIAPELLDRHYGHHQGDLLRVKKGDLRGTSDHHTGLTASRTNALARLIDVASTPDLAARSRGFRELVDLEAFCRLLALEAILRISDGYSYSGHNCWLYLDAIQRRIHFVPEDVRAPLIPPGFPIYTPKVGLAARSFMETGEGRVGYLRTVASLVTNSVVEESLVRIVRARSESLRPMLSGAQESQNLNFESAAIERNLGKRFGRLRMEIGRLPAEVWDVGATVRLPQFDIGVAERLKQLPVKNPIDYGRRFVEALKAQPNPAGRVPCREIEIVAPARVLESLTSASTNWVEVAAVCGTNRFENVGLRLRGHSTRKDFLAKSSFTLKFNWREKGQKLDGQTKLHFSNASYDPSYLSQYVATWLFRRAGLPAPATGFAHVRVNGVDFGLFVEVEGVTKSFLGRAFGDEGGLVFEGEARDIDKPLDVDSGHPVPSYHDLMDLCQAAKRASQTGETGSLERLCNLETMAAFVAAEVAVGHRDGYSLAANNYRVYQKSEGTPFHFLPHGMDRLGLETGQGVFPSTMGMVAQAMFASSKGRRVYLGQMKAVLEQGLDLDRLVADVADATRTIQSVLMASDPLRASRQREAAEKLVSLLADRKTYLSGDLQTRVSALPTLTNALVGRVSIGTP